MYCSRCVCVEVLSLYGSTCACYSRLFHSQETDVHKAAQQTVGDYTLLEKLGQGAFGAVYRGRKHGAEVSFGAKAVIRL